MTQTNPGNFDNVVISSSFFATAYGLGEDHSARLTKYQLCWDFYIGEHYNYKVAPEGFDQVTLNYIKTFVKKMRRFTFRNDWTFSFSDEDMNEESADYIKNVWSDNDLHHTTNKMADFASIFGDWFAYVQWISDWDKESKIKLSILDPRYVFPEYNTLTGEMDFCTVVVPYEYRFFNGTNIVTEQRLHKEIHEKDKIYVQKLNEHGDIMEEEILENPIGKILIVHGINAPIASSHYGESDIYDVIESQKLLDEKVSDVSDIIDYHAAPITVIYGAKSKQLERGANKVWSGLPINSKVENLSSEGNIPASMDFINFIKKSMHEIGNITEDSLGAKKEISNTSAVALSITYEPMIEVAEDKRYYMEKGIKEINTLILDIASHKGKVSLKSGPKKYIHDIEFGDLLPRDRSLTLDELETELRLDLESTEGSLERLGVKEPKKKIEEINKEKLEKAKLDFETNKIRMPEPQTPILNTNGNPVTGKSSSSNPVVHGETVVKKQVKQKS